MEHWVNIWVNILPHSTGDEFELNFYLLCTNNLNHLWKHGPESKIFIQCQL